MIDILNLAPHEVSTDLKGYAIGIYGGPGLGKAQPNSSIIPTFNGLKQMGDIKIGDYVFNRLGEPVKVLGVYPQGFKDIYKITFADGRTAFSCEEHLWTYVTSRKNFKTVPLKEIIEQGVRRADGTKYKYNIPVASPLRYAEKEFPVDPYVVGAFLGDGSLTLPHLTLSSNDSFIPNRIAEILGCETEKTSDTNFNWVFFRGRHENGNRKLIHTHEIFGDLPEVIGDSFEKTIPVEYFEGSIDQRLALLQGLMDTDGSITTQKGKISFSSVNYELAQGVVDLARSLGFVVSIAQYERNDKVSVEFNVQIQGLKNIERVFSLPRKKNLVTKYLETPTKKFVRDTISIRNIEYSHKEEATCIFVDDLEHLYVTENYVVTHNTTTAMQAESPLLIAAEKG